MLDTEGEAMVEEIHTRQKMTHIIDLNELTTNREILQSYWDDLEHRIKDLFFWPMNYSATTEMTRTVRDNNAIKIENKTGTSKVGAISKAQKSRKTFFRKKLESFGLFFQKMSHSAKKYKNGDSLGFININSVAKY